MITISIAGNQADIQRREGICAGQDLQVRFCLDRWWAQAHKTAVFRAELGRGRCSDAEVLQEKWRENANVDVPKKLLRQAGAVIYAGMYGMDDEGRTMTTCWTRLGNVQPSAIPAFFTDEIPPLGEQLLQKVNDIEGGVFNSTKAYIDSELAKKQNAITGQNKLPYGLLTDTPVIPTVLPNPNTLSFTGAATGSYDGSAALEINIPGDADEISYTKSAGHSAGSVGEAVAELKEDIAAAQKQADRTEHALNALWKLNEGQIYDIEQKEESGMNNAPSGAKYMSPEKVYGKSYQDAEPTPYAPQKIRSVEAIRIERNELSRTIIPPKPLNGIGEYKDVLDVTNGVWRYVFKEVSGRDLTWTIPSAGIPTFRAAVPDFPKQEKNDFPAVLTTDYRRVITQSTTASLIASGDMIAACHFDYNGIFINDSRFDNLYAFSQAIADKTFIYAGDTEVTIPIDPGDLEFLRELDGVPASDSISISDQNGNDVPWLNEYIISLREAAAND